MSSARQQVGDAPATDALAELAAAQGEPIAGGGNRPIRLSDPGALWFVSEGSVDVFAARRRDDGVPTDFKHLLRADAGRLLFPAEVGPAGSLLVAKGLPGSKLRLMPMDALEGAGCDEQVARQVEVWVSELSETVGRDVTYRPRIDRLISVGVEEEVEAGQTLSARQGVVWVSSGDVSLAYLGTEEIPPHPPLGKGGAGGLGVVPVTPAIWVDAPGPGKVRCIATPELQREGRLLSALAAFTKLALSADDLNRSLLLADIVNLQASSAEYRRRSEESARRSLFGVLEPGGRQGEDALTLPDALQRVGRHEGIRFRMPQGRTHRRESDGGGPRWPIFCWPRESA